MTDQSSSPESNTPQPQQLALPECSIRKTRRRGKPLRRRTANSSLAIPQVPADVVQILKAHAKARRINYTDLCRAILRDYAYRLRNPGRRR